jgi:putative DNA primase/helicase
MADVVKFARETPEQRTAKQADKYTEDDLALLIEAKYAGRWLHSHGANAWLILDKASGQFREDRTQTVLHAIREDLRDLNIDRGQKLGAAATISAVEKLASRSPALAITGDELDADLHLLGTPDGVIDLRTAEMLEDIGEALITKSTAVAPANGKPERWLRFLNETTGGDPELVDYLQRLVGYGLTGETREESFTFFHGPGGNGKGVFLGSVQEIMGQYATQASTDVFLEAKNDRHPTDLAALAGARAVIASESGDGKRWDEQRVKALTGRDVVSARFMRGDFFTFKPQFKLFIASNHKPRIRTVDDAMRRRLHLVPFDKKPETPDPELKDKLREEYPQILQWAIEGAEWWYRDGLMVPDSILEASDNYLREEDLIGLWFAECCEAAPGQSAARKPIRASYEHWCREMGHGAATQHALTRWFTAHGYEQNLKESTRPYLGVRLLPTLDHLELGNDGE